MSKLLSAIKQNIEQAKAVEVSEMFKPISSGIYDAVITKFGLYTNNFDSTSMFLQVEIKIDDEDEPRVLTMDKGVTLKDGKNNENTISTISNVFGICGVAIKDAKTGKDTCKTWGKERDLESFTDCYNKNVTAFVEETFEDGSAYPKKNNLVGVFDKNGSNSDGVDQKEKFLKKIEETPVRIVKPKKSSNSATTGTSSSPANGANASRRL